MPARCWPPPSSTSASTRWATPRRTWPRPACPCEWIRAMAERFTLDDLAKIVEQRAGADPEASYTAKLLAGGPAKAAKKLGEEAMEAAIAAVMNDKTHLAAEAADVLYHLLVVLKSAGVPLGDVMDELQRRTAQSGLEEKASRRS